MSDLDLSDEEIGRLKQENEAAQVAFIRRFGPCLKSFIKKNLGLLDADAQEVVGDTFYKVIMNIQRYEQRKGAKFSTWVFGIAANTAKDWYKKNRKHACLVYDVEDVSREPDDISGEQDQSPKAELIRKAMSRLDPLDRQILERVSYDVPLVEIAKHLGMEEGTVRQRKRRALEKLRCIYENILE